MQILNPLIEEYVNHYILPSYDAYDKAHNCDHIHAVIENSLKIAQDYQVDCQMVFVIAAYHDIGLKYGRKDHHITSAKYLREDTGIRAFFSEEKIDMMSDAIEEHFQRTYKHIQEKYGENGYLKLWLETDTNKNGLHELRKLLKNKEELELLCKKYA